MKIRVLADFTFAGQQYVAGQGLIVSDALGADLVAQGQAEALPESELGGFTVVG